MASQRSGRGRTRLLPGPRREHGGTPAKRAADPAALAASKNKIKSKYSLTRFSHQPGFAQIQGARYEAVVIHRECLATKQLRKDRLAFMANKDKKSFNNF
jgi:hypothetical protein